MTDFEHSLPPLLEQELSRILRRYRAVRLLRAGARFVFFLLPAVALFAGVVLLELPVPAPLLLSGLALVMAALAVYCFGTLFTHRVNLRDIARHIDRNHPELQDRILSAVVLTESERDGTPSSAWMLEHFLAETQHHVKGVPLDNFMNPREGRLLLGAVALCVAACLAGVLAAGWKLGYLRSAFGGGYGRGAVEFRVEPGDATVQPGENQMVWVTSPDIDSTKYIYWEQGGQEQRAVLQASSSPEMTFYTFVALQEGLRYRVRVADAESEQYAIRVNRPPDVEAIQLEYTYPGYLDLEAKVVPYAGEIAAVEGTEVTVRVEANKALESARLVRDVGSEVPLEPLGDNLWQASFVLDVPDRYHVALLDELGEENPAPEEYPIRVYPDNPPEIQVRFPRGDSEVLALEEIPLAFNVKDDFGVADYGVEYTIAGHEPIRLALNTGADVLQQVTGGHLLALEELGVTSGDLITWSVWAKDRKPGRSDYEIAGDPFFLEVRPYIRRFRERVSQGGPAGQRHIDEDQRTVVIAIYNLRKTAMGLGEEEYGEQESRIRETQVGIRNDTAGALARADAAQQRIGQEAIGAMKAVESAFDAAVWPDPMAALGEALAEAQRAMHLLMRLEPELRQVTRAEGQGGGGGGGGQQEIDELEMAKRKDYQEEAATGAEQVAEQEALRKSLEDLARRQEILNDDLGKLLSEDKKDLEAEEKKRQLERLQEEQARQLERLDELMNQVDSSSMEAGQKQAAREALQQARRNMERGMESARREELQQARSAGSRAAQHLSDAESGLDQLTREGARQRFAALEEALRSLGERQTGIQEETKSLKDAQTAPGVEGQEALTSRAEELRAEKQAVAEAATEMLNEAGGLSDQLRANQELLSRKLGDWARQTSRAGVVEDMEDGMRWLDNGFWEALEDAEGQVKRKLDDAADSLEQLRRFVPGEADDDLERALAMLTELEGMGMPAGAEAGKDGEAAGQPDENGPQAAGQPGEGSQPGSESEASQQAGQSPGAQPGDRPGAGADGGPDEPAQVAARPGEQPGGDGQGNSPPEAGGEPGAQSGSQAQGAAPGGMTSGSQEGLGSGSLDGFRGGDFRNQRQVLRDASSLLPQESEIRTSLEQVEMDLGQYEREYNKSQQLPPVEEFEQVVRRPLMESIATLDELVRAKAARDAQWLEDEGTIPSQYVDRVAEYFRALAEQPASP